MADKHIVVAIAVNIREAHHAPGVAIHFSRFAEHARVDEPEIPGIKQGIDIEKLLGL